MKSYLKPAAIGVAILAVLIISALNNYKEQIDTHIKSQISSESLRFEHLSKQPTSKNRRLLNAHLAEEIQKLAAYESEQAQHLEGLKNMANAKYQQREAAYADYKCTCDGTCSSEKRGRGSECQRKEQQYLQVNQEYLSSKNAYESQLNNDEVAQKKAALEKEISSYYEATKLASYPNRLAALWRVLVG